MDCYIHCKLKLLIFDMHVFNFFLLANCFNSYKKYCIRLNLYKVLQGKDTVFTVSRILKLEIKMVL